MSRFSQSNGPARPTPISFIRMAQSSFVVATRRWHLARWAVAAVAILVLASTVGDARGRATAAERRWSDTQLVWVATSIMDAGRLITSADIESVELPVAALPTDAATSSPIGRRLGDAMGQGEIVREGRLANGDAGPVAALLGPRSRGVTIPVDEGSILEVGDRVELLAIVGGQPLAVGAVVIHADGRWATFSVPENRVSSVVNELAVGGVMPVLVP